MQRHPRGATSTTHKERWESNTTPEERERHSKVVVHHPTVVPLQGGSGGSPSSFSEVLASSFSFAWCCFPFTLVGLPFFLFFFKVQNVEPPPKGGGGGKQQKQEKGREGSTTQEGQPAPHQWRRGKQHHPREVRRWQHHPREARGATGTTPKKEVKAAGKRRQHHPRKQHHPKEGRRRQHHPKKSENAAQLKAAPSKRGEGECSTTQKEDGEPPLYFNLPYVSSVKIGFYLTQSGRNGSTTPTEWRRRQQHPSGATSTTRKREEGHAAPHKRRRRDVFSFLFPFFLIFFSVSVFFFPIYWNVHLYKIFFVDFFCLFFEHFFFIQMFFFVFVLSFFVSFISSQPCFQTAEFEKLEHSTFWSKGRPYPLQRSSQASAHPVLNASPIICSRSSKQQQQSTSTSKKARWKPVYHCRPWRHRLCAGGNLLSVAWRHLLVSPQELTKVLADAEADFVSGTLWQRRLRRSLARSQFSRLACCGSSVAHNVWSEHDSPVYPWDTPCQEKPLWCVFSIWCARQHRWKLDVQWFACSSSFYVPLLWTGTVVNVRHQKWNFTFSTWNASWNLVPNLV